MSQCDESRETLIKQSIKFVKISVKHQRRKFCIFSVSVERIYETFYAKMETVGHLLYLFIPHTGLRGGWS